MNQPARRVHAVHYPETDEMGEHELQRLIAELLRPLLERWFQQRGIVAHAGADTFLYWVEGDPTKRIAPDVYVLPGVRQDLVVGSYRLFELRIAPSFALEVASSNWEKDYDDAPVTYAELGAKELVIFDPGATAKSRRRVRFQVYRRVRGRGLIRVEVSQGPRVHSKALGAFVCAVGSGPNLRVRLAETADGPLFPTEAEAASARAATEAARAATEAARADHEAARADAAVQEVARLRAELARRR